MNPVVELRIPGQPKFVRVARLAASATASTAGFSVEEIEEIRQAVGEACSNAVSAVESRGNGYVTLRCEFDGHDMTIDVSPVSGFGRQDDDENAFQYFLIKTLMDSVEVVPAEAGELVRMKRSLTR